MTDLDLGPERRTSFVGSITQVLVEATSRSSVELRGSLAAGTAELESWSDPASAMANAVAAVKQLSRGEDGAALGLLERGFERIGGTLETSYDLVPEISRLATEAAALEPDLLTVAKEVNELAAVLLR